MTAPNPESSHRIEVTASHPDALSLALHACDVPFVRELAIANQGDEPLLGAEVRVRLEPLAADATVVAVPPLAAGERVRLPVPRLPDADAAGLAAPGHATLDLLLCRGDETLGSWQEQLAILPPDAWQGGEVFAEALAAFVLPAHPDVAALLTEAATRSGRSRWDGYVSDDPAAARDQLHSIYHALAALDLEREPDGARASDSTDARLRLPDRLLAERRATTLELALLGAACLERIGLHAMIALLEGDALVGIWRAPDAFRAAVVHEPLVLKKRVDLELIDLVAVRGAFAGSRMSYAEARNAALAALAEADPFLFGLDLARARGDGCAPLPLAPLGIEEAAAPAVRSSPRAHQSAVAQHPKGTAAATPTRLEQWKHRLLDLSLRNRLLNFRATKTSLPLACPDIAALEDALADDRSFRFATKPRPSEGRAATDDAVTVAFDAMSDGVLLAALEEDELQRRLVQLYRDARQSIQEGGANILYLALGFLRWFETSTSTQPRTAPILLLPLEISRPSVKAGFAIRASGEEPRVNVTLLKKLELDYEVDIRGLDELVEDESGVDVPLLLHRVREAILDRDRWDVRDEALVGLFSFTKFLMWRDLEERTDSLRDNAVVQHLMERPGEPFAQAAATQGATDPSAPGIEPADLDDREPQRARCPLDADSSQLAAVFAGAEGHSFVLQGPPGTGKSQTITNLIAQCLADGQRVLFVSEKMAALNVVHQRLSAVGLAPFCLELHSNKTRKRQVLDQLAEALAVAERQPPARWADTAAELAETRAQLNAYCETLHGERTLGQSPHWAIGQAVALRNAPRVELTLAEPDAIDAAQHGAMRGCIETLSISAQAAGDLHAHPFRGARCVEWEPSQARAVQREGEALTELATEAAEHAGKVAATLGSAATSLSRAQLTTLADLAQHLVVGSAPTAEILAETGWPARRAELQEGLRRATERDVLRRGVGAGWQRAVLDQDLEGWIARVQRATATWFPLSWWRLRPVRAALRPLRSNGALPAAKSLADELCQVVAWRDAETATEHMVERHGPLLGARCVAGEGDWPALEQLLAWIDRFLELRIAWDRAPATADDALTALAVDGPRRDAALTDLAEQATALQAALQRITDAETAADQLLELEPRWLGSEDAPDFCDRLGARAASWAGDHSRLRAWAAYNRGRRDAIELGLSAFVEALERSDGITAAQLPAAFDRAFAEAWLEGVLAAEPELRHFQGLAHEHTIDRFCTLDEELIQLAREEVFARLAANLPRAAAGVAPSDSSEVGVLQRQLKKSRGHWPIRKLLRALPQLLPRLKPCFLMSPLSVAQFLDPDAPPFDVVVFDEASQIPVWDAIGAIGRGDRVVVVGDSKQLPPTTFFDRADDGGGEFDDEMIEELESILDECIAAQLPTRTLQWHYRSEHESLIAFSNEHYYGGRLWTFPSAAAAQVGLGVSWRHIADGCYDRAKTRTNAAEAEAIVAEITARVRGGDHRSLGVVTFSQPQQILIEDLLDRTRLADTELDGFLSRQEGEPLFVKNLENVQGDERDVILFSVGYGPDAQGRVYMNFGPLNKPGGERRLNVAVTRARQQVVVFSTLRPEHIELSRVSPSAIGVHHLRAFLEHAQRGSDANRGLLSEAPPHLEPLVEDLRAELEARGHAVHAQVGRSAYRVDLAVVDPTDPQRYALGIEWDGANYRSAATARDRDRTRTAVLRSLGWRLHRAWGTEWLFDRERELERVLAALAEAPPESEKPEPETPEEGPPPGVAEADDAGSPPAGGPVAGATEPAPAAAPEPYRIAALDILGDEDALLDEASRDGLCDAIAAVLAAEAPITLDALTRRVASAYGSTRRSRRVRDRVGDVLADVPHLAEEVAERTVLWGAGQEPGAWRGFRVPDESPETARESSELPPQEIANAAAAVLQSSISVDETDLVRDVARLFGFARVGPRIDEDLRCGIELLVARGDARREGTRVCVPDASGA
ncbi:MAG: DUF3320 domain-containing protein [Planctomycetota bacterium]